jgi:hypothetical protein
VVSRSLLASSCVHYRWGPFPPTFLCNPVLLNRIVRFSSFFPLIFLKEISSAAYNSLQPLDLSFTLRMARRSIGLSPLSKVCIPLGILKQLIFLIISVEPLERTTSPVQKIAIDCRSFLSVSLLL